MYRKALHSLIVFVNKLFLKKKALTMLVLSFFMVFTIPFIIFQYVVYRQSYQMAERNLENSYKLKLDKVNTYFDDIYADIELIKNEIEASAYFRKLILKEKINDEFMDENMVITEANRFMYYYSRNAAIRDVIIKIDNKPDYYNLSGYSPNKTYIDIMKDFEKWNLKSNNEMSFDKFIKNLPKKSPMGDNYSNVAYLWRISFTGRISFSGYPAGTVLFLFNNIIIRNYIEEILGSDTDARVVINNNGRIIWNTGGDITEVLTDSAVLSKGGSSYIDNYRMFTDVSSQKDIKYLLLIPKVKYYEQIKYIKNLYLVFSIIAYLIFIMMCILLSKINYSPLMSILRKIPRVKGNIPLADENEYNVISNSIDTMIHEKSQLENELDNIRPQITKLLLKQILEGKNEKSIDLEYCRKYGIYLSANYFCVVRCEISYDKCEENISTSIRIANFSKIKQIIEKKLNEQNITGYYYEESLEAIIILLNGDNPEILINYINELDSSVFLLKTPEKEIMRVTIGVGSLYNNPSGISLSFHESLKACEYKIVEGKDSIIFYQDLIRKNCNNFYYPLSIEINLINYVKNGDYKNAEKLLKEIINKNINNKVGMHGAEMLFNEIVSTFTKIVNQLDIKSCKDLDLDLHLSSIDTLYDLDEYMCNIIAKICSELNSLRSNNQSILEQSIMDYVECNCLNKDISLKNIAEKFNISISMVSKIFKDKTGMLYLDYVNKFRIEEAVKLMHNGNKSLTEIYMEIGYNCDNTFRRNFIKYKGINPAEWKVNTH